MKKTILLILVFFCLKSYSQYYKAEVTFLDGTSKNGIARINILNDKILFKNDEESKKEKYNHKNVSKLVLIKDSISHSFRYKKTLGRRAPKLLQVIKENDKLSLYAVVTESNFLHSYGLLGALATTLVDANKIDYEYYIVKNNSTKAQFFGNTKLTSKKRFKEIVRKRLKECLIIIEKVENKEFTVKNIPEIVEYYNNNCAK